MNLNKFISKSNQKKINMVLIVICILLVIYMIYCIYKGKEKLSNTELAQTIIDIKNSQDPPDSSILPGASKLAKLIFL